MPSVVYCDNKDCIYYDDCRGCDVDRLVIERGVCVGSTLHGRNVSENDLDERLKAENAKLRTLVRYMWDVALHPQLFGDGSYLLKRMRELGIEVDG